MLLKDKMKNGQLYREFGHENIEDQEYEKEIERQRLNCKARMFEYNHCHPDNKKEKQELADFYLGKFNLLEYKNKMPCELSGGMQQNLSIARALAFNGDVFLFDEPFKGLDEKSKFSTIEILKDELINKTVLFITHDLSEISSLCNMIFYFEGSPISGEIKSSIL